MDRKLWLSIIAAMIGASLLVAAATAAPAKNQASTTKHATKGGTFVVEFTHRRRLHRPGARLPVDRLGNDVRHGLQALQLPGQGSSCRVTASAGGRCRPAVVSNGGKTYTIKLKNTFKFSDGSKVTASSFVDAFNRNANPKLQSPSTPFMDVIAGSQAVVDGKATKISGVKAPNATTLMINLTKPAPDLVSRLTMPFFQAIPKSLATNADPNGVLTYAGCGPYYFSARTPNKSITLKKNPFYKGGRPANVDTIQVNVGNSLDVIQQNVESGYVGLRRRRHPADARTPRSHRSTASTRAGCSSSRSSASRTSR